MSGLAAARSLAAAALACGAVAAPSPAQNRPPPRPPFEVELDRLVVLAGGGPVGEERTVTRDTIIMRTRLGYAGTTAEADVSVTMAEVPIRIAARTPLLEASIKGSTRETLGEGARVFCAAPQRTRSLPSQRSRGPLGRRYQDEVRPCLVDRGDDGRFEEAMLVGTRWPSDRLVVPIAPVAYAPPANLPLPNSELTVTFHHHSPVQGWVLQLGGTLLGRPFRLLRLKLRPPGGTQQGYDGWFGVGARAYPHVIQFGAARISILNYDREAHVVRLRVDQTFETAQAEFDYDVNTTIITIYR